MKWTTSCATAASNAMGRERQLLCGCLHDLNTGMTLSSGGDEEGRRVDGRHRRWPNARHQLCREGSRAAADVEHPLARSHSREVRQLRGKEARVLAHVAVVCVRGHIEAHRPSLRLPHLELQSTSLVGSHPRFCRSSQGNRLSIVAFAALGCVDGGDARGRRRDHGPLDDGGERSRRRLDVVPASDVVDAPHRFGPARRHGLAFLAIGADPSLWLPLIVGAVFFGYTVIFGPRRSVKRQGRSLIGEDVTFRVDDQGVHQDFAGGHVWTEWWR